MSPGEAKVTALHSFVLFLLGNSLGLWLPGFYMLINVFFVMVCSFVRAPLACYRIMAANWNGVLVWLCMFVFVLVWFG